MHDLIPISNEIPEEVLSNQEKKDLQSINNIKLPTVIENKSNLPMSKEDIVKMHTDSIKATEAGKLMRKLAKHYKTSGANPQIYIQALIKAIECGEFVLRTELALAEELRKIEKHQGVRKDLEKHQNVRTKADIIRDFGLTTQQAKDISMLEDWAVNMAIKESWEKHKVPTREMALKMIKEKHKKENNKPYNPEAIYMDYNRQINAIADEKVRLEESIARYKEITKDIKATVDNLLDIAGNLSDIMHNATPNKQNKLLKLLIKDCTLNGKELKYTVRAPFDKFIQCENPTQWFKDPTSDIETYTKIADEVKLVKYQVLLAN